MNERIEELIVCYLHRGSTPEQERELFEACRNDPDVATQLRQHIALSLKLRMLRDKTEVPQETHNALMRRINELRVNPESDPRQRRAWIPFLGGGTSTAWRPIFGTALVTAAVTIAVFALLRPAAIEIPSGGGDASFARPDTVLLTRVDTVFRTKTVSRPVYIVRYQERPDQPGINPVKNQVDLPSTAEAVRQDDAGEAESETHPARKDITPVSHPTIAETQVQEAPSYIRQYTAMVSSLEQIRVAASDRIRE